MDSRVSGPVLPAERSFDRRHPVIAKPLAEQLHPLPAAIPIPFSGLLRICLAENASEHDRFACIVPFSQQGNG